MGNNNTTHTDLSEFDSAPYLKPGITEREVIEIKNNFEKLDPVNGYVKVEKIREQYQYSDQLFGDREIVNFDEFFSILAAEILYTRSKYKNVEFDNHETDNGCILCGSSTDKRPKFK